MIVDIINKKRLGQELSYYELEYFFNGYLNGDIKDYQMSSLLMAICINGMTDEEIFSLTKIFVDSGDILEFDDVEGIKVDKHSTGGIGDKTTLIIAPIVASLGVPVVKMSGRGLGYTGGTIDKLESIPGFKTRLTEYQVLKQVKEIGIALTGQTANLAPMDKVIYALRDVTGTVSSIPLIASSIMSKKIASGADKILIDIKVGKGALLRTRDDAKALGELMMKIGRVYHREVRIMISDMNIPLGYAVGNSLEVLEAIDILRRKETSSNLVDLCVELAAEMISMGKDIPKNEARRMVIESLDKGLAYKKFLELVKVQNGDITGITVSRKTKKIRANCSGIVKRIDALELGKLAVALGAGRRKKDDRIDHGVGIKLHKQIGDVVKKGEILATLYINETSDYSDINNIFDIK